MLKHTVPKSLQSHLFAWRALDDAEIDIRFGSDAPIDPPSLIENYRGLREAEKSGIAKPSKPWTEYHQHPDQAWGADFETHLTWSGSESDLSEENQNVMIEIRKKT